MRNHPDPAIRDWFTTWDSYVRARDYESARALFHSDVIGFGTHMRVVSGLEHLEQNQWRNVWGTWNLPSSSGRMPRGSAVYSRIVPSGSAIGNTPCA